MNQTDLLLKQTEDAYEWTNKLISSIPKEKWNEIPSGIETNVSWQVGHLVISSYYHSVMTTAGHLKKVLDRIPLKVYSVHFSNSEPEKSVGAIEPATLHDHLGFIQQVSLETIQSLTDEDLKNDVEPTRTPHPIAKTKFDAVDWNIKHTMWHCGQLGMIKRAVDERYDFGLKKPS